MTELRASFILLRETKGALVYQEVDEHGAELDQHNALARTIYLRKSRFPGGIYPSAFIMSLMVTK